MDVKTCLQKLQYVGVLAFATVDEQGTPRYAISALFIMNPMLSIFYRKGKNFCKELLADGRVQILGYTKYKEMIRLSTKAVPAPQDEQRKWMETIFAEQPYLSNVYPGETKEIGIIFEIKDGEIEYFNLGVHPIFRQSYSIGKGTITPKGYEITDACTGCETCINNCPQKQHCFRATFPK